MSAECILCVLMDRLIALYSTQLRILWEWRGGPLALLRRLVVTLVVSTIALLATAWLLPGVQIGRAVDAVIAIILMAAFNALIRPVVLGLIAPFSLILTAIAVLVLQILTFLVIVPLSPGVEVDGVLSAVIGSFVYAAFNTVLTAILGLDRTEPVNVRGVDVSPRDVVAACLPDPLTLGDRMTGKTCAGTWVTGIGKDGRPREVYLYHVSDNAWTMQEYGAQAVVWQTAMNPVIALELLSDGTWSGTSCPPP